MNSKILVKEAYVSLVIIANVYLEISMHWLFFYCNNVKKAFFSGCSLVTQKAKRDKLHKLR